MNTATSRTAADAARLPIMLAELRLPTVRRLWSDLAEQANREGWPAERFLGTLLEREMSERQARRLARNRADSRLPLDKSLDSFDFAAVPAISKGHVTALAEADVWLAQGVEVRLRCLLRAVGEGFGEVVGRRGTRAASQVVNLTGDFLVGVRGFEPPASASRT